jgi:predicted outer membrane protein
MLYNNHTKNLKSTLKIGEKMGAKLVDTDAVISLKKNEENELAKLKTLDDKAFQLTFLNAMIKGHTEVLQKINQDLQNISNPALKNHFELTGKMIEKHLDKAKSILNNLKSNS